MRKPLVVLLAGCLIAAPAAWAQTSPERPPDYIPPAFRAERHFAGGRAYLEALPDGTKIVVDRADGSSFTLSLAAGKLTTTLPASRLADDGSSVTTPLGYTFKRHEQNLDNQEIVAPNGRFSVFTLNPPNTFYIQESDGGFWEMNNEGRPFRLADGTRLDTLDKGLRWEILTLTGERFSLDFKTGVWSRLPDIPSPPLIPDLGSSFLSGDGDDWRIPYPEDHVVFAWSWISIGLTVDQLIKDVSEGSRRSDLDFYFNQLETSQPPADLAVCIVGRRLALVGGDRVTFEVPGKEPYTGFILPGALEPDYILPKAKRPTTLPAPNAVPK